MKQVLTFIILSICIFPKGMNAQIRNVMVEKYYVSDTLDATDSTNWNADATYATHTLPVGSKTYRVYVQLDSGYKIHKIYGTSCHPLKITSTATIYNNISRPDELYGYLIKKQYFPGNPLLALDSWLTLGICAKTNTVNYVGVPKPDDYDGSVIGGTLNNGGTFAIAGGLLVNNDTSAHIPLTTKDGMVPSSETFPGWIDYGFTEVQGGSPVDTTVFGSVQVGSRFVNTAGYLQQNGGVKGDSASGHKVLVAQVTTTGDLSFELNIEVMDSTGGIHNGDLLNFVASAGNCDTIGADTTMLGMLKYPPDVPVCGCSDPNFLEYNANAPCVNDSLCIHRIVFGCMDTLACNYDANANYHIQYLCCYPGKCNDRDIALVCPGIISNAGLSVYPNPASNMLTLQITNDASQNIKYTIYDAYGTEVANRDLGTLSGVITQQVDVSAFQVGLYLVRVYMGGTSESRTFMKN